MSGTQVRRQMSETACKHCGKPIVWEAYWTTWDHADRRRTLDAELCEPAKGFHGSTYAAPGGSAS